MNEKCSLNGQFGWCFICREQANYFSIKARLPICSHECSATLEIIKEKMSQSYKNNLKTQNMQQLKGYMDSGIKLTLHLCSLGKTFFIIIIKSI